jgi:hypothetical protein
LPQAARGECGELRRQLAAQAAASLSRLRAELAGEARAIAGLPVGPEVPQVVQAYIKVRASGGGRCSAALIARRRFGRRSRQACVDAW